MVTFGFSSKLEQDELMFFLTEYAGRERDPIV